MIGKYIGSDDEDLNSPLIEARSSQSSPIDIKVNASTATVYKRRSRNSLSMSSSSPNLLSLSSSSHGQDDDEDPRQKVTLSLSPEEKLYLPYYHSHDGIKMKGDYLLKEAIPEWGLKGVHYLSSEDRKKYEIKSDNGVFHDFDNNLLHGLYLYVLFPNNQLYGCKPGTQRFHSYLSSGLNLKAAGLLYCHYGTIITISNESGHYQPTYDEMLKALSYFRPKILCPFILEDHSALDLTKVYQGVKHFEVSHDNMGIPVLVAELDSLRSIISSYTEQASLLHKTRYLSINPSANPASSSSDMCEHSYGSVVSYYEYEGQDINGEHDVERKIISRETTDENIFKQMTCLARMDGANKVSRFLGNRKLSK